MTAAARSASPRPWDPNAATTEGRGIDPDVCTRAIVDGVLHMRIDQRRALVTGASAWLDPLCHLLGAPGAVASFVGPDGTVAAAVSTLRRSDTDAALVGARLRSVSEWAPLIEGVRRWTEADHARSSRALRPALTQTGSSSVVHLSCTSADDRIVAIVSVLAPLVAGRSPDFLRRAAQTAELLGWALGGTDTDDLPLARASDLQADPREIVAAMADALTTSSMPVVHLAGLGVPAVANPAAVGVLDGASTTPRDIVEHPLVGHDLIARAVFGDGHAVERKVSGGTTRAQVVRSSRGDRIDGIVIAFPRQMAAAPGPSVDVRRPIAVPTTWDLSRREHEVVSLLLGGERVPMIASKLYVSADTVRGHLKRVYRKVGVSNQVELIVQARALAARPS